MIDQDSVEQLVESLRQDVMPVLSERQLELTLGWLAGSKSGPESEELASLLGPAGKDHPLAEQIFSQVDAFIFRNDELCLHATGLNGARTTAQARRRFRLLLSAFHPDRMHWHADWLTPRFQAINLAYRQFKLSPELPRGKLQTIVRTPSAQSETKAPPRYEGISPGPPQQRSRWHGWRQDRWLGHKVVALLSLFVILPLASWSLDAGWWSSFFERDQLSQQGPPAANEPKEEYSTRHGHEEPPTVAALLEQWNILFSADHAETTLPMVLETVPADRREQTESGEPGPITDSRDPTASPAPDQYTANACTAEEPAQRFGGWLSEDVHWAHADMLVGARPSRLRAAAIEGHALADALENYRQSVEVGNLGQLMRNYVEMPRANVRQGERWLLETYGTLFEETVRRSLSMDVVEAYRRDDGWNVVARYRLGVRLPGCARDHLFEHELRFYLVQDPLIFRVAAVDY